MGGLTFKALAHRTAIHTVLNQGGTLLAEAIYELVATLTFLTGAVSTAGLAVQNYLWAFLAEVFYNFIALLAADTLQLSITLPTIDMQLITFITNSSSWNIALFALHTDSILTALNTMLNKLRTQVALPNYQQVIRLTDSARTKYIACDAVCPNCRTIWALLIN